MVMVMSKIEKKLLIIFRSIVVFCLFYLSVYAQYIPIYLFHLDVSNLSDGMGVVLSTFSSLLLVCVLFVIYRKELKKEFHIFRKNFIDNMDIGFKCWVAGLVIMMVSNLIITYVFKAGGAGNENAVQEMIKSLPWLMVIDAGILAPFNEEIVFRKTLKDVFSNKWIFILGSFLLFGGAHVLGNVNTWVDCLYIIPYGALGGAFAFAYSKTDTVFTSMSMHMIHNLILVVFSIIVL